MWMPYSQEHQALHHLVPQFPCLQTPGNISPASREGWDSAPSVCDVVGDSQSGMRVKSWVLGVA